MTTARHQYLSAFAEPESGSGSGLLGLESAKWFVDCDNSLRHSSLIIGMLNFLVPRPGFVMALTGSRGRLELSFEVISALSFIRASFSQVIVKCMVVEIRPEESESFLFLSSQF